MLSASVAAESFRIQQRTTKIGYGSTEDIPLHHVISLSSCGFKVDLLQFVFETMERLKFVLKQEK